MTDPLTGVINTCVDPQPWVMVTLSDPTKDTLRMEFRAGNGPRDNIEVLMILEAAVAMARMQLRKEGLSPDAELEKLDAAMATEMAADKENG